MPTQEPQHFARTAHLTGPASGAPSAEEFLEITLYIDEILTELRVWDVYFEAFGALLDECLNQGGNPFRPLGTGDGDVLVRRFHAMENMLENLRIQDWEAYGAELKHAVEVICLNGEYRLPGPLRILVDTVTCTDEYDPFDFDNAEIERLVRAAVQQVRTPGADRPIMDRLNERWVSRPAVPGSIRARPRPSTS